ncbi:hypothetical protein [Brachyspira hyodysenteriae]|uniref:Uncharacterized protein n=1 Tax=Brachyspira hyodysenteriae (strain ATCC 49526 / WA1) TaxID=565034 RepID=A0A3B6V9L7_BRAHW|nr:hypothetical protein [Brachyspira hyodysenteriae]ACN84462.1 hypothetical protein BHWA1_02002 [Brachyspira hyodysenteriae WA1]AUJ50195.1 hypothetical protein BH718_01760 [Brachyspira hyodysenteriae]MCZ9889825.1 hypothetical protein [Brachyspira hyodysenteriae]MCZ9901972.1 hypothetical protein [Brachyspira hyodysenteriae]MCZ9919872.1 hypothetical protein [Brachyspira hyodysenteriae]
MFYNDNMLNINSKYFNLITNKNNAQIKDGDVVRYSIMRKLDNDKALINVMGNKLIALFKNGMTDKGFALVSKKNGEVTLTILKNAESLKEARENIQSKNNTNVLLNITENNSEVSSMLSQKGIKPSYENIRYFETILKYLPDLDSDKKKFILNAMSNGVYLTVEEINSLGNIFKQFNDIINAIKNSNKNTEITEILLMLANSVIQGDNNDPNNSMAENLNNYINANASFNIWFMLFDMLQGELSSNNSNMMMLMLKVLSANRKNRNFQETAFMIPIPFIIDGEVKDVLLYINKDENNKNRLTFAIYEDDKDLCKIDITKDEYDNKYLITVKLFDKKLFNKLNSIREDIDKELSIFENIKINYEG